MRKEATVIDVSANRNSTSIPLISHAGIAPSLDRSAQKMTEVQSKNAVAHRANKSSTNDTATSVLSKVFISATTVTHRPARFAELDSRPSNSSRPQLKLRPFSLMGRGGEVPLLLTL